jgi:hypothetical protein
MDSKTHSFENYNFFILRANLQFLGKEGACKLNGNVLYVFNCQKPNKPVKTILVQTIQSDLMYDRDNWNLTSILCKRNKMFYYKYEFSRG